MAAYSRSNESSSNSETVDKSSNETFEDVVLRVDGKKLKANSGILAFSSPVFAGLLRRTTAGQTGKVSETDRHINMRFPSPRYEFRSESSKAVQTTFGEPLVELTIPNHTYKDIKKTLSYLVDKNGKRPMSDETAWKLLPIAEEYKLKALKEKCGETLFKALKSLRDDDKDKPIHIKDVLRYLACAEKYAFRKMKVFCIEESASSYQVKRRKDIVEDKHISETTKIKILDQMCENMTSAYAEKLEKLKAETDRRFEDVGKKMKQQKEVTENWKEDTKQEVDAILTEAKKAHVKLVEELKQKEIIEALEERLKRLSDEVLGEIGQINEQIVSLEEIKDQLRVAAERRIETDESWEAPEELAKLLKTCEGVIQTFGESLETNGRQIEEALYGFESHISNNLRKCDLEQIETSLANNFDMQDAFERLVAESTARQRDMSNLEVDFEKLRIDYDRVKAELRKYTKKVNRVNTWIKWARPVDESEDKCLCFRHVSLRSARQ